MAMTASGKMENGANDNIIVTPSSAAARSWYRYFCAFFIKTLSQLFKQNESLLICHSSGNHSCLRCEKRMVLLLNVRFKCNRMIMMKIVELPDDFC